MPTVYNKSARLITFYTPTGKTNEKGHPLKHAHSILPTKDIELTDEQALNAEKDKFFAGLYEEGALDVTGFENLGNKRRRAKLPTLGDKMDREARMKENAATPNANPHSTVVDQSLTKEDIAASQPEERSKDPIEPTPVAGVPGNSKQAIEAVKKMPVLATLHSWRDTEVRATVEKALVKRIDELEALEDDGEE